jgi:excisionase family DNA binding protein
MMNDEILTTAQTAKLLGVSVRTAQLLIEGGSLPSWKTPGGHRRVYRRDVEAIITENPAESDRRSAHVIGLASGQLRADLESAAASIAEYTLDVADNRSAALLAIGETKPAALIVDGSDAECAAALVASIVTATDIAPDHVVLIAEGARLSDIRFAGVQIVSSAWEAASAVRELLSDPPQFHVERKDLPYPVALNEQQRLIALERSGLVDSAPEEAFDRLVWLAANTLDAPIALVTLLTPTRQFFKARVGLDMIDTPRSWAFCNHTILQKDVFSIEDLSQDPRFTNNPAVAGDEGFRFYAGAPIRDESGYAIGSLCVIDFTARSLDARQRKMLAELAELGGAEIRLRDAKRQLQHVKRHARRPADRRQPAAPLSQSRR